MSICFFTKKSIEVIQKDYSWDGAIYESNHCGHYILMNPSYFSNSNKFKSPQQLLRCAALNIKAVDEGFRTVWLPIHLYENSKFIVELENVFELSRDKYKFFCLENEYNTPVRHDEKPIQLLKVMADKTKDVSGYDRIHVNLHDCTKAMILWSESEQIMDYLLGAKYISFLQIDNNQYTVKLTPLGWSLIREKYIESTNKVFIAKAFNWSEKSGKGIGQSQGEIDFVNVLVKVCKELGYEASPLSQDHNENFVYRILNDIKHSAFVIADFTHNNNGVYFEAGYAKAIGKEVFHLVNIDHSGKIHADIKQIQYLEWDDLKLLKENLKAKIEVIVGKYKN